MDIRSSWPADAIRIATQKERNEVLWWWWCNSGRSDPQQVNNVSKIKRVAAVSNPKHFSLLFLSVRVSQELLTKKKKKKKILEKQNKKKRIPFSLSVPKMALQPNKTKSKNKESHTPGG